MITHIQSVPVADAPLNEIISPFATGADNASAGEDTTKQLSVMQAFTLLHKNTGHVARYFYLLQ